MHNENEIVELIENKKFDEALKCLFENIEENPNDRGNNSPVNGQSTIPYLKNF